MSQQAKCCPGMKCDGMRQVGAFGLVTPHTGMGLDPAEAVATRAACPVMSVRGSGWALAPVRDRRGSVVALRGLLAAHARYVDFGLARKSGRRPVGRPKVQTPQSEPMYSRTHASASHATQSDWIKPGVSQATNAVAETSGGSAQLLTLTSARSDCRLTRPLDELTLEGHGRRINSSSIRPG